MKASLSVRRMLIAAAGLLLVAGCGRGVVVESEPGPVYRVIVDNPMPHAMEVRYDDGATSRDLGTVAAEGTEEFVIAAPETRTVEIIARDQARTHTVTRTITLLRDAPQRVTLTP